MVKSKEEILEALKARIGESDDDETLTFVEDVSDTLSDLESRGADTEDWKAKYEENDKAWRTRYKERFFGSESGEATPEVSEPEEEKEEPKTFDDLFTEGE